MANLTGQSADLDVPGVSGQNTATIIDIPGLGISSHILTGATGVGSGLGVGVKGETTNGDAGVFGENNGAGNGVLGRTSGDKASGVYGENRAGGFGVAGHSEHGVGVLGRAGGSGALAARFEGDVEVTGDIRLTNADCAEDFGTSGAERIEAGTVVVIDQEETLYPSRQAYDRRVAGVVSGAGGYKPGITLDRQPAQADRVPVALLGKVYCKVDAHYSAIEAGDLLTTSPTPGHAMKVTDPHKAFGAVIGKALRPLAAGQGLIPILIALQ